MPRKVFSVDLYVELKEALGQRGYWQEIDWAETVGPPAGSTAFFLEYAFVVINSGMKAEVARGIYERVIQAVVRDGRDARSAFRHPGKSAAIQSVYDDRVEWHARYRAAEDKLAFLASMPWIGPITKYHLAKNFGLDCVKPDRHLVRIAQAHASDPHTLCSELAEATGDRIGTVDYVLWRAAALGLLAAEKEAVK